MNIKCFRNPDSNLTVILVVCLCLVSTYAKFGTNDVSSQPESYFNRLSKVSKTLKMSADRISPVSSESDFQADFQELVDVIDLPKIYHKAKYRFSPEEIENILFQELNKMKNETTNSTCVRDIGRLIVSLFSNETRPWALQFFDATGKPGPSLTHFWLFFIGNYDQCRNSVAPPSSNSTNSTNDGFSGNYCPITLSTPKKPLVHAQIGVCVPSTCSAKEINELFGDLLALSKKVAFIHSTQCLTGETEMTTATVFAILILVLIGIFVVLGTVYDFFFIQYNIITLLPTKLEVNASDLQSQSGDSSCSSSGHSHNGNYGATPLPNETSPLIANGIPTNKVIGNSSAVSVCGKFFLAFSLYTNGQKLLNTSQGSGSLGSIHGIRFLSMTWVVLGHTYAFGTTNTVNLIESTLEHLQRVSFDAIVNALVSVDTFFTLSGLLTAYLTIKELKRTNLKINWAMFYFHRFWRLTPPYMLCIVIVLGLQQYFGSGPFWGNMQPGDKKFCERNWWTNLLYVNNLVRNEEMCFGHSWYLANDMQFFLVSPLMMVPFYFHWAAGVASCTGFLLICWITTGVLSYQNDWNATILYGTRSPNHWFQNYYIAPWCRIGPYVVGILAGYFLSRTNGKPFRMHWILAVTGWVVATASALAVLYGVHGEISGHHILSPHVAALYNAVGRSVWGACVSWVVIACSAGYGGPINALLSWSPFVSLGRLTYMTYLIHLSLLSIFFGNFGMTYYLNDSTLSLLFIGILVVANMVAFVFVLLLESPMIGLEKALWRK